MKPILISIGPVNISSLGFFLCLSFLIFTYIVWKKAKEKLYEEETIFDAIFFVSFFFFVGARLGFILLNLSHFGLNVFRWILFTGYPGFYFYGGLISSLIALWYIFHKKNTKIPFWEILDYFTQGFVVAFMVAQIGVLLDGKEIGKFTNFNGIRHPTAIYRAFFLLVLLTIAIRFRKKIFVRNGSLIAGLFGLAMLFAFFLINFLVDNFTEGGVYYLNLTLDQWVNIGLIFVFLYILYKKIGYKIKVNLSKVLPKK